MDDKYQFNCVLLVDDDSTTNFLNKSFLSEIQFCERIESTEDIEEALRFIENCYLPNRDHKSLLIFLDINMPVMDGFEFLDELNSRTEIPIHKVDVIILSSSLHRIDTERAKKYKILDYLIKPLTTEKLLAALHRKKEKDENS